MSRCDVWSSDAMPVDVSDEAARGQKAGFVKRHNCVGTGQGTVIRVIELLPGTTGFMHRTETLDYAILMAVAFVLIDADAVKAGGQELRTHYPA